MCRAADVRQAYAQLGANNSFIGMDTRWETRRMHTLPMVRSSAVAGAGFVVP